VVNPQHYFYHADGNGNITALVDTQQFIVAKYLYDPYGNVLSSSGPLAPRNRYQFSSKECDLNSGLIYYLYRYNDPTLQRWLNRDPLGEVGALNLYAFVYNSPVNVVDPYGLLAPSPAPLPVVGGGSAGLSGTAGAGGAGGGGVFGFGTAGALGTSVGEVGLGTIALGGTVAAGIGGTIGYAASQLPVTGGGTVADFWGGVIYDTFWPKSVPNVQNMARREDGHNNEVGEAAQLEAKRTGRSVCDVLADWMRTEKSKGRCADNDYVRKVKEAEKFFGCRHRGAQ
jgi:RHS repeat-associated protein